ncbi:UvrD-helicase domain-containing protein [Variovorax sp. 770b2]|uniref:UvrD-helicase domain-containing protein n=1 Tax=Variovorax sp. 770b2 TaxID=1566271 RepID=UPI0008DFE49E|nr:ATP-dependent helicase [Variovorax sp. 770b2]SFQ41081.1 Superfamily I DNA or RNA helicase [Variovorax sp. 770b2]
MESFEPTAEQSAIIDADLVSMAVVACPGSGKTATAVRRLVELRDRLSAERGRVALLSFSNIAVDTFREEYQKLRGTRVADAKVIIQTVDSFLTTYILRPHCARVMKANRAPFLCIGDEPFLNAYKVGIGKETMSVADILLNRVNGKTILYRKLGRGDPVKLSSAMRGLAVSKLKAFAATGGYTHTHGRAWARLLLEKEPAIARALALRFPQILVDEAQDVGTFEGEILDLLIAAGSTVSLIGDFHQSIYGFNFASGDYLRSFAERPEVRELPLTQNRRSLPAIVSVANALALTKSKPHRTKTHRESGAFYWRYEEDKLNELMSAWATSLQAYKFQLSEAAVLCRGTGLLERLITGNSELGVSAVKHLAAAALERDKNGDISRAFSYCVRAVLHLVEVPQSFARDLGSPSRGSDASRMRRLIWDLIRQPGSGIPSATLDARGTWLTNLKANLTKWLDRVETGTALRRVATWTSRVTARELPEAGPLLAVDLGQNDWNGIRVGTVHSAKGEGIPAVMYLALKKNLDALVAGTAEEEGRIGYVAATRACDLFVIAIPQATSTNMVKKLKALGFSEWGLK